ncbi:sugar transferase [Jannaschia aquimarina]|uniref:PglC_2 protein n=2 Tax=Jannaschia aquimarina TaxID=935700 RepID=A0A0D1CNM6_9RHOB|nr:sugar transferase [Jannaschia aquimarina]KIT16307.1 Undecaprenyl phosphate N,N'-diacetylbacillosamine 1-phosphate transferase [Jannaschia aquimarina]SNT26487.1 Sugar transferase involved in LPS biosynthesis (colanic, teichoic acid) [Jannaschia aquimarina]
MYRSTFKRVFDLVFALMLLPLIAPIVLVLWLAVRRDGGPGFFGHVRIGRDGKPFKCWKLRSMRVDAAAALVEHLAKNPDAAAEWARDQKLTVDPRVTPLGAFLRKSSLDELPQLWNVIRGDMSLVGPRPIVRAELPRYGCHAAEYMAERPGVTGLWQVSGRNDVSYDERVMMDVEYQQKMSFRLDIQIILGTLGAVIARTGR